jgi:hypothetical protein
MGYSQRHAYRDWWPCLMVGLACWMMGIEKLILCTIGKKIFCTGPIGAAQAEQNRLVRHVSPNEPIKEGSLSFVLPESLFTSVAIGWQGPPLSVSLGIANFIPYLAYLVFKLLRSPGTDSKDLILPAYVAWRANTTTLFALSS